MRASVQGIPDAAARGLLQQLPSILEHVRAATAVGARVLVAAAAGYDGDAAVVVVAHLMASRGLPCHEATIEASRWRAALQLKVSLKPYTLSPKSHEFLMPWRAAL